MMVLCKCLLVMTLHGLLSVAAVTDIAASSLNRNQIPAAHPGTVITCPETAGTKLSCKMCALMLRDFTRDLLRGDDRLARCCNQWETREPCSDISRQTDSSSTDSRRRITRTTTRLDSMYHPNNLKRHYIFPQTKSDKSLERPRDSVTMMDIRRFQRQRHMSDWIRHIDFLKKRDDLESNQYPSWSVDADDIQTTENRRPDFQTSTMDEENDKDEKARMELRDGLVSNNKQQTATAPN